MSILELCKRGKVHFSQLKVGQEGACINYGLFGRCLGCQYRHEICTVATSRQAAIVKVMESALAGRYTGRPGSVTPSASSLTPNQHVGAAAWLPPGGARCAWVLVPTGSVLFCPQSSLLTESVLKGRTVISLYFSADWFTPCQAFTPLLKHLYSCKCAHCTETNRNIPSFEVVLVS